MGKWGNGEMGTWGNGETTSCALRGEVGKWGSGETVSSPYYLKTLSPYLLLTTDSR
ncbi:hypothetical protein [Microcystis sp. M40BS1]|uniref:hypothetical protein n=1 Tax=Microcystis sp. M40BS1 TaxID=2771190 RepID=UPI0025830C5F|nr:hypothetical protein [Microcystis sp. M40BS1]MCA2562214.1 hypothetical protein [Microcystis sp. M40BS1]